MITTGELAPNFTLRDQNNVEHSLTNYRGQWVLLYFYPKDDTPGCTKEACVLRDALPRFEGLHALVFGISKDTVESHKKFADKYGLPFPLLADETREVIDSYGVWQEKNMYGKKIMGVVRSSFLIDPEGVVRKVYEKVKPETHADEVLEDLATLAQ